VSVDAVGLGSVAFGAVFLYAGIKGISVGAALTSIVRGTSPATLPVTKPITITTQTAAPATAAASPPVSGLAAPTASGGQAALQQAAALYGWGSGAQWQALSNVEMAEAGFNPNATNPSSGAYGLAQALGHGNGAATQGSVTNEYGGFGLSSAQAQAANSGDAGAQALWMVGYIAATYGTPEQAWSHEQEFHWY
jgi:hypothetical protein